MPLYTQEPKAEKNKNFKTLFQFFQKDGPETKENIDLDWLATTPYKRIERSKEAELILADDSVLQFVRIEGTGASSVSLEEQTLIIQYFYSFLSKNKDHFFTEITQFPVNTQRQRQHLQKRLEKLKRLKVHDERQLLQLEILKTAQEAKLERLRQLEENLTNSEYIGWFYASSKKEMSKMLRQFSQMAVKYRLHLSPLTRKEKEQLLYQLNNPNTKL